MTPGLCFPSGSLIHECDIIALTTIKFEMRARTMKSNRTSIPEGCEFDTRHGHSACTDVSRYWPRECEPKAAAEFGWPRGRSSRKPRKMDTSKSYAARAQLTSNERVAEYCSRARAG